MWKVGMGSVCVWGGGGGGGGGTCCIYPSVCFIARRTIKNVELEAIVRLFKCAKHHIAPAQ